MSGAEGFCGERDPNGVGQHEAGAKLDAGKNRLGLVLGGFSNALQAVGEVGTFGADKYTDNGWKEVENGIPRYTDALMRHQLKELAGEQVDQDSEMLHAAHTAWNALARLELILTPQPLSDAEREEFRRKFEAAHAPQGWCFSIFNRGRVVK